ncbi:MAG TPA: DoxX family protein [Candidatus Cryosericum sp.]|nr:DoxX family protein [Candidatus Cryosericum sp.]
MQGEMIRITTLLGRVLLSLVFVASGLIKAFDSTRAAESMTAKGIPMASALLWIAIACELLGALSLVLGFRARAGAALLLLFLIPTTLVFHNFWSLAAGERTVQLLQFLKNAGIMGGLLLVCAYGAGPLSLDARSRR